MQETDKPQNEDYNELNNPESGHQFREQELSEAIRDQDILIAKLRLAEERSAALAAIVDSTDDAIISKDLNGFVTSWNAAAERIFGYTAAEMIGVSITKLIPVDRAEEESHILPKIRMGERVAHFETQRLTKAGSVVEVSLTISPIKDTYGKIIGVSKIARDISAIKANNEKSLILSAIVDSTGDAIISKNLNGIITSWNPSAQRIFGYHPEEIVGQSVLKLIPEDRQDEEMLILSRLRRGERVKYFHTKRLTKSGRLIDVSLTISPVKDEQGVIVGVSKIVRDITDMIEAEKQSAMLSSIVSYSDDAIISKDLNSIVTSWNNSAERIFGYTAAEMIGQSITKLIPEDRQQEEPQIISRLKNRERVDHFETKRVTKSGKLIDVSLTISPVMDLTGRIIGVSKIARDITDKKLEEQRKNDFIAIVSHELKTPLTSMRSYVQLALAKAVERADTFSEKLLLRAETQTRKMTTLIHDFLNLSRLEEGKMALNLSEFSLSELMEEVLGDTLAIISSHQIKYEPCTDVAITADREKIGQVLTNLLGNAVKYSPEGTTIRVRCDFGEGHVALSVIDQGHGIAAADQARLFERFYRVNDERQYHVPGFGIGLYLVSEILKLHGGEISVQSEPGKGSAFSFSLPLGVGNKIFI
jgi:two-component system sensor histidine kinase VicK